ncbi:integration host factor [Corynebacterium yudongzhengii]|uniref:Integration host factor n=1 Tax=Corynebacterium yudongzhengii TaxID=2080740 RepID=A0A2U1T7M9_9CORY|nr:integration host factor, actinobacterial type [Corynebacterium yudongzhengii]AWB81834.1 integration host factor [Corynebacterium yudongzhengii]PWC02010.1 integration host factor [Corynebacterium yudongzhengii]
MALPKLTDEQRKQALAKAAEARKARAELKAELKRGGTTLKDVLEKAESDEIIGKTKVSAILEALPKVGKVKAKEIMDELEIAPTRRLRGLGERQRVALLDRFGFSGE